MNLQQNTGRKSPTGGKAKRSTRKANDTLIKSTMENKVAQQRQGQELAEAVKKCKIEGKVSVQVAMDMVEQKK